MGTVSFDVYKPWSGLIALSCHCDINKYTILFGYIARPYYLCVMEKLKQTIEVELDVNPISLASIFCSMDADEQALFFNAIADESSGWPACNFDLQMQYISDSASLLESGRKIMKTIGDYSERVF